MILYTYPRKRSQTIDTRIRWHIIQGNLRHLQLFSYFFTRKQEKIERLVTILLALTVLKLHQVQGENK